MGKNSNKLELEDISRRILSDKTRKDIPFGNFIVVISGYRHCKERMNFELSDSGEPVIKTFAGSTFYFYNDFYDFKGNKFSTEEVTAHYNKYFHTFIKIPNKKSSLRIDYRALASKGE